MPTTTYTEQAFAPATRAPERIGNRHTIKLCNGRSIAVQASRLGTVVIDVVDSNGKAASIESMSLDPMTAGVLSLAIEHANEAIEVDKQRRGVA